MLHILIQCPKIFHFEWELGNSTQEHSTFYPSSNFLSDNSSLKMLTQLQ